jgi:hypothetical protein
MYRVGSLVTVEKEISKYNLDLVEVHEALCSKPKVSGSSPDEVDFFPFT